MKSVDVRHDEAIDYMLGKAQEWDMRGIGFGPAPNKGRELCEMVADQWRTRADKRLVTLLDSGDGVASGEVPPTEVEKEYGMPTKPEIWRLLVPLAGMPIDDAGRSNIVEYVHRYVHSLLAKGEARSDRIERYLDEARAGCLTACDQRDAAEARVKELEISADPARESTWRERLEVLTARADKAESALRARLEWTTELAEELTHVAVNNYHDGVGFTNNAAEVFKAGNARLGKRASATAVGVRQAQLDRHERALRALCCSVGPLTCSKEQVANRILDERFGEVKP